MAIFWIGVPCTIVICERKVENMDQAHSPLKIRGYRNIPNKTLNPSRDSFPGTITVFNEQLHFL